MKTPDTDQGDEDTLSPAELEFNIFSYKHLQQVAEYVWDKAVSSLVYSDGTPIKIEYNNNPYRNNKSPKKRTNI